LGDEENYFMTETREATVNQEYHQARVNLLQALQSLEGELLFRNVYRVTNKVEDIYEKKQQSSSKVGVEIDIAEDDMAEIIRLTFLFEDTSYQEILIKAVDASSRSALSADTFVAQIREGMGIKPFTDVSSTGVEGIAELVQRVNPEAISPDRINLVGKLLEGANKLLSNKRVPEEFIVLILEILFKKTELAEAKIEKRDGSSPRRVFQHLSRGFGKSLGCSVWIERTGGKWIIAYEPYSS